MQKYIDYFIKKKKRVSLFSPHDSYNTDNILIHKCLHGKIHFLHNGSIYAPQVKIKGLCA